MPQERTIIPLRTTSDERAALAGALRRTGAGDRAAFEEVYRRTSAKLFSVCLRILPGRQEAEEALQEAYLAIWRRAATFDEARGGAMAWLITLTRNRAVDRLRAGGRLETTTIDLADTVPDPAPDAEMLLAIDGDERQLARCLGTLDPQESRLIRAAFFEGATYAELATRSATPLGTIKSRIRRALMRLRDCLA